MKPSYLRISSASVLSCLGGLLFTQDAAGQLDAAGKEDIGFTSLQSRLGAAMPTGSGISVSMVEIPSGGNYRPDSAIFPDKDFVYPSGGSSGSSSHATNVGRHFFGPDSLAPDIGLGADDEIIASYETNHFLNNVIRTGQNLLPEVETNDIQNHSWVGNYDNDDATRQAVRRMDYMIARDGFVAVFGLNNGSATDVPGLFGGAYNGITVGLSGGNHSTGGTTLEGGMRTRPDIVVPLGLTSYATPTVGGAAALLIETARGTAALNNADTSVVVKSLLFTGATRDEPEFTTPWANSPTQPLDERYGAGELNIDRSHAILEAGEFDASDSSLAGSTGWDAGVSSDTTPSLYFFELDDPGLWYDVAASLVWNRDVTATDIDPGPGIQYEWDFTLADLNLRLYQADGFALGTELAASLSTVDNVELITFGGLASGRYAWQVSADTSGVDYGFSWYLEGVQPVPEPSAVMVMLLLPLIGFVRRR